MAEATQVRILVTAALGADMAEPSLFTVGVSSKVYRCLKSSSFKLSRRAQRAKHKLFYNGHTYYIAFKQKIIINILPHSLHKSNKLHTADGSIEDTPLVLRGIAKRVIV